MTTFLAINENLQSTSCCSLVVWELCSKPKDPGFNSWPGHSWIFWNTAGMQDFQMGKKVGWKAPMTVCCVHCSHNLLYWRIECSFRFMGAKKHRYRIGWITRAQCFRYKAASQTRNQTDCPSTNFERMANTADPPPPPTTSHTTPPFSPKGNSDSGGPWQMLLFLLFLSPRT